MTTGKELIEQATAVLWDKAAAENMAAWGRVPGYRGAPMTETRNGIVYHTVAGKTTTARVKCADCGQRQPAGTETLTAYGGEPYTRIEKLHLRIGQEPIGRCSVCATRGPLVEIKLIPTGSVSRTRCDRRCLDARGDECNCGVCFGRDHGAGICTCGAEKPVAKGAIA